MHGSASCGNGCRPEFEDIYDLLTDFRFGGYRILGDIVCDMEDENTGREKKQLFRESDSKAFTAMMSAFADKSASQGYRDAVTVKCRELLTTIVRPTLAVRYVVALGRRDLLWDLLPGTLRKMFWRCGMINEWEEFCAYTGTVSYTASKKSDTTWLGRFTFATILEFEGMARILTVLARGYLFHGKDGAVISGDPHDRIDYARRALCAWCSVPEDGKRVPDKEWQFRTDFSELHTEFPELVDADGVGWFLRHVLRAADFMLAHPEKVRSTSLKYAEVIQSKFAAGMAKQGDAVSVPDFRSPNQGCLDAAL